MKDNPVFNSFMERLDSATCTEAGVIIGEAYSQYVYGRLDDQQYGKIYFKALRIINRGK